MSYVIIDKVVLKQACELTVKTIQEERDSYRNIYISKCTEYLNRPRKFNRLLEWFGSKQVILERATVKQMIDGGFDPMQSDLFTFDSLYLSRVWGDEWMQVARRLLKLIDNVPCNEISLSSEDASHLRWKE